MILIVDYGIGNLFSLQSALNYLDIKSIISSDPELVFTAKKIILPGVGSFNKAMENIRNRNLFDPISHVVKHQQTPILGVCLGMQLLGISSIENGFSAGFGFIDTVVERFSEKVYSSLKVPHVGFDTVLIQKNKSKLFDTMIQQKDFYFTHSYRMPFTDQSYVVGSCLYGEEFIAAFEKDHICGVQFHPEKSQTNGLCLLKNFVEKF